MRSLIMCNPVGAVSATSVIAFLCIVVAPVAPQAAVGQLELVSPIGYASEPSGWPIPPDGSQWQGPAEAPQGPGGARAVFYRQTGFSDNGDGVLSVGDEIYFEGTSHVITNVAPAYAAHTTYFCATEWQGDLLFAPMTHNPGPDPVGESWLQLNPGVPFPSSGSWSLPIVFWADNDGDGTVSAGDHIGGGFCQHTMDPYSWGITAVRAGIAGEPTLPTDVTSWGRVKASYR